MKKLVIIAHPDLDGTSRVNKSWRDALKKYPDTITVHELYKSYPDLNIDVNYEHSLLLKHNHIVLQFPLYWYSCPSLLRQWFDDVFSFQWAYGIPNGDKLKGKVFSLAISAGDIEESYAKGKQVGYTLEELMSPFFATINFVMAKVAPTFAFYGIVPETPDSEIERSTSLYLNYILGKDI